jgi:flagellin-like hook-associated protein FlgL
MSVVINTNSAATSAAYNLSNTNVNLQRSLNRLSSGSRINSSYDDAGGIAVSMKLSASIRRTEATTANVGNAIAFLQTQDGVLKSADKVLSRMSELASLATDVTKNASDIGLYNTEYATLKAQLQNLFSERFNGISLFSSASETGANLTVVTSHDGDQEVQITQSALTENPFMNMMINGFKKFEVDGRTFISRSDAINVADFTDGNATTGLTVYDIETGEEFLMNAVNPNSTAASYTPNPDSLSTMFVERHNVAVNITKTDGSAEITGGTFEVDYSNDTTYTTGHVPAAVSYDDLLGDHTNESSVEQLALNFSNSSDQAKLSQLAIQAAATMRANNGAEQSRLTFAADMLAVNKTNLESANSRILDVDVADESTKLARFNILQQAGTAMLAQANQSTQSILRLLM